MSQERVASTEGELARLADEGREYVGPVNFSTNVVSGEMAMAFSRPKS